MATPDAKRAKMELAAGPVPMAADDTAGPDQRGAAAAAPAAAAPAAQPVCSREHMQLYYSRLFPAERMFSWLAYGNDTAAPGADPTFASRRELCFTLDGDVFARYQSFPTAAAFGAALAQRVPTKIDIGPVYTVDPRQRAKYARDFRPLQRELVFDVDLTDYDDVRSCGSGGHICARCWPLMAAAVAVVDAALREDFGFRHVTWVYSGRRGVHCWVADEGARLLADDVRAGVVGYLSVYRGAEGDRAKLAMGSHKHPSLERAHATLLAAWREHILPAQEPLEDLGSDAAARLLRCVPDEELVASLTRSWAAGGGGGGGGGKRGGGGGDAASSASVSVRRWDELAAEVEAKAASLRRAGNRAKAAALLKGLSDAVFGHAYPRLDVEVTKKMNHLLKAPFCVHPKTGRVCVPLDVARVWEFDPDAVPSLGALVAELRAADAAAAAAAAAADGGGNAGAAAAKADAWRATALAPYIAAWDAGFLAPLARDAKAALAARAARDAAEQRRNDVSW